MFVSSANGHMLEHEPTEMIIYRLNQDLADAS
jgi:hypothetical protein